MSVVSSTLAVGGVVGLVVTGLLTGDAGDYHRPFWVGFGVGLVALLLAVRFLPSRPPSAHGRVDVWGAVFLGLGLVLLLLPLSQGSSWGWASTATIGSLVAAALVLAGWVVLQRRRAQPLVRPALLTDRRMLVPNVAGLMTGVCIFVSFLGVLQYVRTPPQVAGYGFGASALTATLIYLLPGGIAGIGIAPLAGRVVARAGGLPTLLTSGIIGIAGFALLAFHRNAHWAVALAGLLTQVGITVAYAALPALVVQAVRHGETGVANAVNSIARSVGQALGSTVAVAVLAGDLDPATGLPRASAYTLVSLIGVVAASAVAAAAAAGLRTRHERRPDDLAEVEAATAGAGEWSPVSGLH
jgi:predicted MFS family arabinose efflux permease